MSRKARSDRHRWLFFLAVPLLVLLAGTFPTAARADWLVMKDGTRVETDGAWTERGRLLVFTDTSGNLVSLRASDVDLEASYAATAAAVVAAEEPPAPAPEPKRPSVMKITDDDVGHLDPEEEENSTSSDATDPDAPSTESAYVRVSAWDRLDMASGDGTQIRATLTNTSQSTVVGLQVTVTIFDDQGAIITNGTGRVSANGLAPQESAEMVVDFPDVYDFTAVDFDIRQSPLTTRSEEDSPLREELPVALDG